MKTLYLIYEFFFDRWKWEIIKQTPIKYYFGDGTNGEGPYKQTLQVTYQLTNKFDGSKKIKIKEVGR